MPDDYFFERMYYIFMDESSDSDSDHHNFVKMKIDTYRRYSMLFYKSAGYTFLCIFIRLRL